LTLLIRYFVRARVATETRRIAILYGVNTAGAAVGAFLADFALVPAVGLRGTQLTALGFNLAAAIGALLLARREEHHGGEQIATASPGVPALYPTSNAGLVLVGVALALSGFAALGFEILWFRHFTVLLGGFRAVFALLVVVILAGIAIGSLVGALLLHRREHAAHTANVCAWLMVAQALFVVTSLAGLLHADADTIRQAIAAAAARVGSGEAPPGMLAQVWFNALPILLAVAAPALLMGLGFPLANAIVQRESEVVGRRAGMLYLANTFGAVCGSLVTGFLLLPVLGIQSSAAVLASAASLTVVALWMAAVSLPARVFIGSGLAAAAALAAWLMLPGHYLVSRTFAVPSEGTRLLVVSEGLTEVIAVTEAPGAGRTLFTNGHPMSSNELLAQRYMRALAHIPLLSMDRPQAVLVIGFGVGNTVHAATLHPTVRRVDVVDLSRHVLEHAHYFEATNAGALSHPRVRVHVNDGRQHLLMRDGVNYDLITLEPPPIVHAGVAALYSREFYSLARDRLEPGGYLSQWLPVSQVPPVTALTMVRAFLDVFPQSVLLSGAQSNLLLLGTTGPRIEIEPARVEAALASIPAVRRDLQHIDLGSVREVVGTFVGSAQTMASATEQSSAAIDDRPVQEYDARSLLNFGEAAPASLIDVSQVAAWCPQCFSDGKPIPVAAGLDTYLAILDRAYSATAEEAARTRGIGEWGTRLLAGSAYLGATVPESPEVHAILGAAFREAGQLEEAVHEFEAALRLAPRSARVHNDLGITLAMQGRMSEAIERFEQALAVEPGFGQARQNLATARRQQQSKTGR
jgi:spermidine synthase/tetratricopeptide (TPR) repeat protein